MRMMNATKAAALSVALLSALAWTPTWAQETSLIHIPGSSVPDILMAEWETPVQDNGKPQRARIGSIEGTAAMARAPENATRYTAKEYNFPMGTLRVLNYKKDAGPVVHQITFETQLMMLEGSATVGSGGKTVSLQKGDAVFLPSDVLRNPNPDGDTVVATWIVSNKAERPKSMVVRGDDLPVTSIAQWMDGDEPKGAFTPEDIAKAPAHAGKFDFKRYAFDGNSIRHAMLHKGGSTTPGTNGRHDILIYITKGRMLRTEDGVEYEVVAGDAIREEYQKTGLWDFLEESEFLATDMPFDPSQPRFNVQRTSNGEAGGGYPQ